MVTSTSTLNLTDPATDDNFRTVPIKPFSSSQLKQIRLISYTAPTTVPATVSATVPVSDEEWFNQKAVVIQTCFKGYLKSLPARREQRIADAKAGLPVVAGRKRVLNFPFEIGLSKKLGSLKYTKEIVAIFRSAGLGKELEKASLEDGAKFAENWLQLESINFQNLPKIRKILLFITDDKTRIDILLRKFRSFFEEQRQAHSPMSDSVVVVTSTGGNGHKSAAYALAKTLFQNHGWRANVRISNSGKDPLVDILGQKVRHSEIWNVYTYGKKDKETAGKLYRLADSFRPYMPFDDLESLVTLLQTNNAGAIVVNHPKDALLAAAAAKIVGIPVIASSTDVGRDPTKSYGWRFQRYLSSEQEYGIFGSVGLDAKAPKHQVPPVCRPGFTRFTANDKNQEKLIKGISIDTPYFLMTSGGLGSLKLVEDLDYLISQDDNFYAHPIVIKVICGKNSEVKSAVETLLTSKSHPQVEVRVAGFQNHDAMISDFKAADYMIGKPGGSTSAECFAAGVPLIANDCIGGESGNLEFLISKNLGVDARGNRAFIKAINDGIVQFQSSSSVEIAPYTPWSNTFVESVRRVQLTYKEWNRDRKVREVQTEVFRALQEGDFAKIDRLVSVDENRDIILDKVFAVEFTEEVQRAIYGKTRWRISPQIWMFFLEKMDLKSEDLEMLSDVTKFCYHLIKEDVAALNPLVHRLLESGKKEELLQLAEAAAFTQSGSLLLEEAIKTSNTVFAEDRSDERTVSDQMFLAMLKNDTKAYRRLLPKLLSDGEEESLREVFTLANSSYKREKVLQLLNAIDKSDPGKVLEVCKKFVSLLNKGVLVGNDYMVLANHLSNVDREFFIENIVSFLGRLNIANLTNLLNKISGSFSLDDAYRIYQYHSQQFESSHWKFRNYLKKNAPKQLKAIFSHVLDKQSVLKSDWFRNTVSLGHVSLAMTYYNAFLKSIPKEELSDCLDISLANRRNNSNRASWRTDSKLLHRIDQISPSQFAIIVRRSPNASKLTQEYYTEQKICLEKGLEKTEGITEDSFVQMAEKGLLTIDNLSLAMGKFEGFSEEQYISQFHQFIQILDPSLLETFVTKLLELDGNGKIDLQRTLLPNVISSLIKKGLDVSLVEQLVDKTQHQIIFSEALRGIITSQVDETALLRLLDIAEVNIDVLCDAIIFGYSKCVIQKIIDRKAPVHVANGYEVMRARSMFTVTSQMLSTSAKNPSRGVLEVLIQNDLAKCRILAENGERFHLPTKYERVDINSQEVSPVKVEMLKNYYMELNRLVEVYNKYHRGV